MSINLNAKAEETDKNSIRDLTIRWLNWLSRLPCLHAPHFGFNAGYVSF